MLHSHITCSVAVPVIFFYALVYISILFSDIVWAYLYKLLRNIVTQPLHMYSCYCCQCDSFHVLKKHCTTPITVGFCFFRRLILFVTLCWTLLIQGILLSYQSHILLLYTHSPLLSDILWPIYIYVWQPCIRDNMCPAYCYYFYANVTFPTKHLWAVSKVIVVT